MKRYRTGILLTLAAAGLLGLAMGCAPGAPATPTPAATTPPFITVLGAPALAFDKLGVDLGTVLQDQEGVQTFLVINKGDKPLKLGRVSIHVEQGGNAAETVEGDTEIQPGDVVLLPVRLGPYQELGPHRLLVSVESNDPDRPVASLFVHFTVAQKKAAPVTGPRLHVDKETIAAGVVPYDSPLYEQFTLRNDGDAPLVLENTPIVRVEEGC